VALAECCVGGPETVIGAEVELGGGSRADALLFGESPSRILVTIADSEREKAGRIARDAGAPFEVIGRVGGDRLRIGPWIDLPVASIHAAWRQGLARALRDEG
jgi:phosphoribosylformylglycinamidine synthase